MTLGRVLIGLFLLAYGGLVVLALRRPLLVRLALREAARRPLQSAVVVLGLMVGGASIVTLQVFNDSQEETQVQSSYIAWGRVDLTVDANHEFFSPQVASRLASDPEVAQSLAGVQNGIELVASVGDLEQRLGKPTVLVIGFDPATQDRFGTYLVENGRRTNGQDLGSGEALLSRQLAEALQARPGDRLRVSLGQGGQGVSTQLTVAGIARPEGPGASGLRPAIFVPLNTLQNWLGTDQVNVVRLSALGDGQAELDRAKALAPRLRERVGDGLVVRTAKADEAASRRKSIEDNRPFAVILSLFIVLAGATLVVNLTLSVAEERRPRLAILRALGLTRAGLVQVAVCEGAVYSLTAALIGVLPGWLFAWWLTGAFVRSNAATYGGLLNAQDLVMRVAVRPETVLISVAAAALITLVTIFFSSLRTAGLTISSAIKNLPDHSRPQRRAGGRRTVRLLLALIGVPALVAGPNQISRYAGGLALIVLAVMLARGLVSGRILATVLGVAITGWSIVIAETMSPSDANANSFAGFLTILAAMVGVIFSLCIMVAANMRVLEVVPATVGRKAGQLQATLRPSLAYLSRRPVRSGLGIGAFAIILGMLALFSLVNATVGIDYARDTAGYDVAAFSSGTPSIAVPAALQVDVTRSTLVHTRTYFGPLRADQNGQLSGWSPAYAPLYELSDEQISDPPVRLTQRDARFKDDHEVFTALRDDPSLVLANSFFQPTGLSLVGRDGPVTFKVVGQWAPGPLWGIIGSQRAFAAFSNIPAGSTLLLQTASGVDPAPFATSLRRALFDQGVDADTTRHLVYLGSLPGQGFIDYVQWATRAGLVVGVLSLGLLVLRALIERRRVIGLLRALGYRPGQVLTGMLGEAFLTATAGILVGVAAGVVMGSVYAALAFKTTTFALGWPALLASIGSVYVAVLLAALVPAMRASRLPAAEALRMVD